MKELSEVSELTLDDLAALQDSPVAEELASIAEQIDDEQRAVDGYPFQSYV